VSGMELRRFRVISDVIDKRLTQEEAMLLIEKTQGLRAAPRAKRKFYLRGGGNFRSV
jgi:hypothetical protein